MKLISILTALFLICTAAMDANHEQSTITIIGGADGPTSVFLSDIHMLDGPGSYLDEIAGIVTAVTDVDFNSCVIFMDVDDAYTTRIDAAACMVVIELTSGNLLFVPKAGDHVLIRYPGGVTYEGVPLKIVSFCNAELIPVD